MSLNIRGKTKLAWVFFYLGLLVLAIQGYFMVYAETADAVIAYVPPKFSLSGSKSHPDVTFTDAVGVERREQLITDFLTLYTDEEKGDHVTVEYLPFYPAYVRRKGTGWFFWLTGTVFTLIGLYELIRLNRLE